MRVLTNSEPVPASSGPSTTLGQLQEVNLVKFGSVSRPKGVKQPGSVAKRGTLRATKVRHGAMSCLLR